VRGSERTADGLLGGSRRSFGHAEQEEARERTRLLALVERERQLRYGVEQASTTIRMMRDPEAIREARVRLESLERERQVLLQTRRWQEGVLDRCREQTRAARMQVDDLEQRAARLRDAIRHAEHQAITRQRGVGEIEAQIARLMEELPRARGQLAETDMRLTSLRRELAELEGG
jgi:chromosome segregation ATPase